MKYPDEPWCIEVVERALKPFAEAADRFSSAAPDGDYFISKGLTIGHLRAARDVYAALHPSTERAETNSGKASPCVACEGHPTPPNDPCAVCGRSAETAEECARLTKMSTIRDIIIPTLCVSVGILVAQPLLDLVPYPTRPTDAYAAERRRQIEVEGFSAEHDDRYLNNELLSAAACYVAQAETLDAAENPAAYRDDAAPIIWPWNTRWWKPKDPRRDLVRAAALIVAEIERLDRKGAGS